MPNTGRETRRKKMRIKMEWGGEVAQQLRGCDALAEDSGSVPSAHITSGISLPSVTPVPGNLTLYGLHRHLHTRCG